MKKLWFVLAVMTACFTMPTIADAAWTPEGKRCVTSNGASFNDWVNYRVRDRAKQAAIEACMARLRASRGVAR